MKNIVIMKYDFVDISNNLIEYVVTKELSTVYNFLAITIKIYTNDDEKFLEEIITISQEFCEIEKAFINRVILIAYILELNKNSETLESTEEIWKYIYDTTIVLEKKQILSSIGSQGFLSILLYRKQSKDDIKILRLHIWDYSLIKYMQKNSLDLFAIHSHKFHAQSWILSGKLLNTNYFVNSQLSCGNSNYFKIEWREDEDGWKSFILNTGVQALLEANQQEAFDNGDSYTINAGEFHKSEVNLDFGITSTLFLFNSKINNVDLSYVVGPSNEDIGPQYEYETIDATYLLDKLNSIHYDR